MGILSAVTNKWCDGNETYFTYTPVDEINRAGFSVLTAHYQQRYHLNVWTGTSCTEYRTPVDNNGNLIYSQQTTQACSTSLPAGSSGTVQSYNAYVVGQNWREGMWRGGIGYVRNVPLNSNGTINWGSAPAWSQCCSGGTAPLAQEGKIVGNHFYLNVFEPGGTCTEYKTPLNNNGDLIWASQTTQPCRTSAPGSGAVQSYNIYVLGESWREGIWRNSLGYVRTTPLNSTNTDINYSAAPGWSSCCSGATVPDSQGGDILTYP